MSDKSRAKQLRDHRRKTRYRLRVHTASCDCYGCRVKKLFNDSIIDIEIGEKIVSSSKIQVHPVIWIERGDVLTMGRYYAHPSLTEPFPVKADNPHSKKVWKNFIVENFPNMKVR